VGGLPEDSFQFQSDKKSNNVTKEELAITNKIRLKKSEKCLFLFLKLTETAPKVELVSFSNASQQKLIVMKILAPYLTYGTSEIWMRKSTRSYNNYAICQYRSNSHTEGAGNEEDPGHDDLHCCVGDAGAQQLGRHPPLRQSAVTELSTPGNI
jgi:hypothetical protein